MPLDTILAELKRERDRLNQAITALEGVTRAAGAKHAGTASKDRKRPRTKMSADARRRISEAKKEWWAKKKKSEGSTRGRAKSGA